MWVCAHLGVFNLWVNIPELGEGWGKWRGWVAFGFGGARSAVGWACVAPRCGHLITPADSRAALVGRVWPWPARLSAARRHQATTILTPSVISHPFPALQRAGDERPVIAQKRIGHQPRNTKRIRGQVYSSRGDPAAQALRDGCA